MRNIDNISHIYFLGIGGIGMSAIARYAKSIGKNVAGYDLSETPLTRELASMNMAIHYTDDTSLIPEKFTPQNTWVVHTPAVPQSLNEYQFFKSRNYTILKRSELLGLLTQNRNCIAVAGTHGKTSVSTMIAFLMREAGLNIGAFLGGISLNFNSNMLLPAHPRCAVVAEADEYDRSFLHLFPNVAVITSIDPDHLDIYGKFESISEAFGDFVANIQAGGKLLINQKVEPQFAIPDNVQTFYYSLNDTKSHFYAQNISIENNRFHFDFFGPGIEIRNVCMTYPGRINLENMIAAMAVALMSGADSRKLQHAVPHYLGVARRFHLRYQSATISYIDDYAHHPRELEAIISSVRELYRGKKLTGIFQPHLYSRTRDFAGGFARSLDLLDEIILLEIYPAREKPIEGVSAELIFNKIKNPNKIMVKLDQLPAILAERKLEVLMTLGAGNIDKLIEPICDFLKSNEKNEA